MRCIPYRKSHQMINDKMIMLFDKIHIKNKCLQRYEYSKITENVCVRVYIEERKKKNTRW